MAKKRTTSSQIRQKETFGGANIDHFNPQLPEGSPKAINMTLSFEDALKLHICLGQILGKLNSYDRSTKVGRRSAMNLSIQDSIRDEGPCLLAI